MQIYLIGSLQNPAIPDIANQIEAGTHYSVFSDWFAPGKMADVCWREYSKARGMSYQEALASPAAQHIFEFDKFHIDHSDLAVMAMPAGRSGHLELGYCIGQGKKGYVLFDGEPERWDVMLNFASGVFYSLEELIARLHLEEDQYAHE